MTVIRNSDALKLIKDHLNSSKKICDVLYDKEIVKTPGEFTAMIKDLETHLDIAWYMIDKYMDLSEPNTVLDIYRTHLHIGYELNHLQTKPEKGIADALSFEIEKQLEEIGC